MSWDEIGAVGEILGTLATSQTNWPNQAMKGR